MKYRGFLVEVMDADRGVLRWKRFVRTEGQAKALREEVLAVHGAHRHVRITRVNSSSLPTRTTDATDDRWWERLSKHEIDDLTQGRRSL